ncbi:MAG: phosphatase [Prolixibacteraceae bacterium]
MEKKIAIIDLGTNTCNLLIAEYQDRNYRILHQSKEVVKLGRNGIEKNMLTWDALERTVLAFQKHQTKIAKFKDTEITALATSAIREAKNRDWFQMEIQKQTGISIQIISGDKEADLIFKGVQLAFDDIQDNSLILDIGGGSNEFILASSNQAVWKQSFPLGMARIIEQFPISDPITAKEINQIHDYFNSHLEDLWIRLKNRTIPWLIGCSGAFDTLADIIDQTDPGTKTRINQELDLNEVNLIYQKLIESTKDERIAMKGMEPIRIEMIVPAVIFISLILEKLNIRKIYQTDYALREGVLYELIFN